MSRLCLVPRFLLVAILSGVVLVLAGCARKAAAPVAAVVNNQQDAGKGPGADANIPVPPVDPAAKPGPPLAGNGDLADQVLPADKAPDDAPLRPVKGSPIYRLTHLRIGNPGPGPGPKLMVHYERLSGEEAGAGPTLVIRTPDGNEHSTLGGFGPFQGQMRMATRRDASVAMDGR